MCENWHDFRNFISDMGERPSVQHSIDRINNNGNYSPENCRWVTRDVQMRNTRRNIMIGDKCLTDAANRVGINPISVRYRRRKGLPLLVPVGIGKKLKSQDATEIRRAFKDMNNTHDAAKILANKYGIKKSTVWNICARRIWKKAQ